MKVLYFHQHFSTPKGAGGIRSYQMARKLIEKGHEVTIVCGSRSSGATGLDTPFIKGKRRGMVEGIDVIEFDLAYSNNDGFTKRTLTFISYAFRSVLVGLTEKYDIVFATTTPLTAGIPGIAARWLRRKPFVFEVRDLWPELPKAMGVIKNPVVLGAMSVLEWVSYRSAHRCIGLSPGIVEGIKAKGVPEKKIEFISNGCDLDIFMNKPTLWKPVEVNSEDFMAVFTGTHGIANGLDSILDAALELKNRNRDDIKVVLIGQGKLKSDLKQRAQDERLTNIVFHDSVSKEHLSGLMASADIGLQVLANIPAFYYGTSPNKFFDYIAAGLPVINNYPGWLADMIEQEKCGFAVPPQDAVAFADALEYAADNRDELKTMGENSQKLARQKFDRTQMAEKWVSWVIGAKK